MATRAQQASSAERKAARLAALAVIEGEPLPLPTEPREQPIGYTDDLPAECVQLGAQGLSEAQIAAHWAIDVETLRAWGDAYPPMKAALSRARTAMRSWWEEKARRAIVTGDNRFPAGAWSQVMRARFSEYDDKPQGLVIDLSGLVVVHAATPGLPAQQGVIDAKPLNTPKTIRLAPRLTASDEVDASSPEGSGGGAGSSSAGPDE